MTTLALKTPVASKIVASAQAVMGQYTIKSGRFWYKSQQNCDLVYLQKGKETIIHASGGVRFRIAITTGDTESFGTLSLLGWLRETPNAIRIVRTILADHSREIGWRREQKAALEERALLSGQELPEMTESLGTHFSVKVSEEKLEEKFHITPQESEKNFEMAVKSRWYHQGFVNFCRSHGIKCYYRSVFTEVAATVEERTVEAPALAHALH